MPQPDVIKFPSTDQKRKVVRLERQLAFGAADTVLSFTIETSVLLMLVAVNIPNFTNAITGTILVQEMIFGTYRDRWTKSGLAKGVFHQAIPDVSGIQWGLPIDDKLKCTITLSGAPGSTGTVDVVLYGA